MQADGVLMCDADTAADLQRQAKIWFTWTNRIAYALAAVGGASAVKLNYDLCSDRAFVGCRRVLGNSSRRDIFI